MESDSVLWFLFGFRLYNVFQLLAEDLSTRLRYDRPDHQGGEMLLLFPCLKAATDGSGNWIPVPVPSSG
jgi:hypothetical protein